MTKTTFGRNKPKQKATPSAEAANQRQMVLQAHEEGGKSIVTIQRPA